MAAALLFLVPRRLDSLTCSRRVTVPRARGFFIPDYCPGSNVPPRCSRNPSLSHFQAAEVPSTDNSAPRSCRSAFPVESNEKGMISPRNLSSRLLRLFAAHGRTNKEVVISGREEREQSEENSESW